MCIRDRYSLNDTYQRTTVGHIPPIQVHQTGLLHDAYRLEGENEELGFEEMFEDGGVCVIEWPMYIQDILPDNRLEIHMTKNKDQTRHMTFVAHGQQYQQLLKEMNICCN